MPSLASTEQAVHQCCDYLAVDTSGNSTTVYTGPCIYYGAVVTTALSAHVVLIQDGTSTIDNLAASSAIATRSSPTAGIYCSTSLIVNPDDSSTGNIVVWYRPI